MGKSSLKMEKKGASHVEFILAFVIFVGFVIFALTFFSPAKSSRVSSSTLDYALSEVENGAMTNVEVYSIKLNRGVLSAITPYPETVALNIGEIDNNKKIRAFNRTEDELASDLKNDNGLVDWEGSELVYLHISKEIESSPLRVAKQNTNEIPGSYELAISEEKKVLSEKKILEIVSRYDSDYKKLKEDFNLPNRIDFSFKVVFSEQEIILPNNEPERAGEVFSDKVRKEVVRTDGRIVFADLIVTVW